MLIKVRQKPVSYPTPDIEGIKRKRGSFIFQSYKQKGKSLHIEDTKLEELKNEWQAIKIKSMDN